MKYLCITYLDSKILIFTIFATKTLHREYFPEKDFLYILALYNFT